MRKGRTKTPSMEAEARYWKATLAAASDVEDLLTLDMVFSEKLDQMAGDPIGESFCSVTKKVEYIYDPAKEARALKLAGLVSGERVPVVFHLEAFLSSRARTEKYDYRVRRAVTEFGKWLETRPEGNSMKAVTRRTAAHFMDSLMQTLKPHTLKGWKSSLSLYWDWLHTAEATPDRLSTIVSLARECGLLVTSGPVGGGLWSVAQPV